MTLPSGRTRDAAERAIELVDVVEGLDDAPSAALLAAIAGVFDRWGDRPDDQLDREVANVVAVVSELGQLIDATDVDAAAARLNDVFDRFGAPPRLVHEPQWGWHLHVDRPDAGWAEWLAASSAMGLANLLSTHDGVPWGRCAASGCRRPFIDRGRRAPQRFCTTACATRERVRRHRAG